MMWRHLAATDLRTVIAAESRAQVLCLTSDGHQEAMAPILAKAAESAKAATKAAAAADVPPVRG